ncbi:MAG TPA: ATP-binding protein, partial [Solirubrobacteraceae bacterium]|nr:ATP-binding protein [Solirubrobacteraceae bacterium]
MASVVSPVFVGRRSDLQAAAEAFAQARRGEPAVVIVGGEAGVGKTRLVEEVAGAVLGGADPDTLAPSLHDVLLARADTLSDDARHVLRMVSAAGSWAPDDLVAAIASLDEERLYAALREAVEHQLLVVDPSGRGHAFRHSLAYEYRFPGETGFSHHDAFAARAPIFIREPGGPGQLIVPLQSADHGRILPRRDFGLEYRARTIPAHGELTFVHYYVTTRSAGEIDAAAARLLASLPAAAVPAPHDAGGAQTPAVPPRFSRHGRVRVRKAGRTFRVVSRDRVTCANACPLHVSGRRVVPIDLHVAAGE